MKYLKYVMREKVALEESKGVSRIKTSEEELWAASCESARSVSEIRELVSRETLYLLVEKI